MFTKVIFTLLIATLLKKSTPQLAPILPVAYNALQLSRAPYREQNLCVFMSVGRQLIPYDFWTCGLPIKQKYCGVETTFRYKCCPGYKRTSLVNNQCAETVSVWRLLHQHFQSNNLPILSSVLLRGGIPGFNDNSSTAVYTIFAPYSDSLLKGEVDYTSYSGGFKHPVLMHVVKNRFYSVNFKNKATIQTLYNKQSLKVTTYSNGLVFIECRALVSPDHEARNGIVHYISGPILPHVGAGYRRRSVLETLQSHSQTSEFAQSIPQDVAKLLRTLGSTTWFTVFAPSNAVWRRIKTQYGSTIALLVRNHIISKMICGNAITRSSKSLGPTLADEYIGVDCRSDRSRYVIDSCGSALRITKQDLLAGNGVVHVLDGVLIPYAAMAWRNLVPCMATGLSSRWNIRRFQQDIKNCDIRIQPGSKYIWLIPNDAAYTWFEGYKKFYQESRQFQNDASYRCNILRYHVYELDRRYNTLNGGWWNQMIFKTNYGPRGSTCGINYYVKYRQESRLFFHYARTTQLKPFKFANGFVYIIDRINVPPQRSISQIMRSRSELSIISNAVAQSGFSRNFARCKTLFLAPRNQGWGSRAESKYSGRDLLSLLKLHTIKMYLWGGDVGYFHPETFSSYETILVLKGKSFVLRLKRNSDGNMFIGYDGLPEDQWALVVEWNLHGTDGMIWIIDWPLACPPSVCQRSYNEGVRPKYSVYTIYSAACNKMVASGSDMRKRSRQIAAANPNNCVEFKVPPYTSYEEVKIARNWP